jgi:hypothetical protein
MRTLVDLLNDEQGYVRIYVDQGGFGYEKSTYLPLVSGDLFDRMGGYPSVANAKEVAQLQLQALRPTQRSTRRWTQQKSRRKTKI